MSPRRVILRRPRSERASSRGRAALRIAAALGATCLLVAVALPPCAADDAAAQGALNVPSHLGINILDAFDGLGGVWVMYVVPDSGADAAGIRAGDRVTAADGHAIQNSTDLVCRVQSRPPGATIALEVRRNGEVLRISTRLGPWPDDLEPPRLRDCEAMH